MLSEKQERLFTWWQDRYDAVIAEGSIRSGKSYAMSIAYIFWAMHNFNACDFIMAGQSIGSLKRNVVIKLTTILKNSQSFNFGVKINDSKSYFDVFYRGKRNRFYLFGGSDAGSYATVQGLTSAGAYFDECTLLNEEFVNQCLARCSITGAKFWFNCNPSYPLHWFKTEWVDLAKEKNICVIRFLMEDNPSNSEETIQKYKERYRGVFLRRYINGEWASGEGIIYDNWKEQEFDYKRMLLTKDYYGRFRYTKLTGQDFGYTNSPSATAFLMLDKPNNILYFYDEIYKKGLKSKGIYDNYKKKGYEKFRVIGDSEAPLQIDELQDLGINIFPARKGKGSVQLGIQKAQSFQILVHPQCVNAIMEFSSYSWANDKKTGKPINEPLKESDHLMDAMRYALEDVDGNFTFS